MHLLSTSSPKATLIISVYKDLHFLNQVINSLKLQSWKEFEVIISEDGNCPEMREFVAQIKLPYEIQHLSQDDLGWRKNRALNRAIQAAKSDWLVFIDGDCVLHHRFMEFHWKYSHRKKILAGKRVKLDPATSQLLISDTLAIDEMNTFLLKNYLKITKNGAQFVEEGFFIDPNGLLGFIPKIRSMRNLKGCNMSFHRFAIEAINGFDEEYTKPAVGEDADLLWRFQGLGYEIFSLRNLAVQYHLYHKECWVNQDENLEIMKRNQQNNQFFCKKGLTHKPSPTPHTQ